MSSPHGAGATVCLYSPPSTVPNRQPWLLCKAVSLAGYIVVFCLALLFLFVWGVFICWGFVWIFFVWFVWVVCMCFSLVSFFLLATKKRLFFSVFLYLADQHLETVFPDPLCKVGGSLAEGRTHLASQCVREDPKGMDCGWAGWRLPQECSWQDPLLCQECQTSSKLIHKSISLSKGHTPT